MISRRRWLGASVVILGIAAPAAYLGLARRFGGQAEFRPAVTFEDVNGQPRSLADFRGKYVLLNVWATWCPPCVKEMPSLDKLQALKGDTRFEVVVLSVDRKGPQLVKDFYLRANIRSLGIYLDREARSMSALRVTGLPMTLLLDPSGVEVARWAGMREWDKREMMREIDERITERSTGR